MSLANEQEPIDLIALDLINLHRLANSETADIPGLEIQEGALPPRVVALRAIEQLARGTPPIWCVPLLIISPSRRAVLGACGFKTAPVGGSVEISYGVARQARRYGVATRAITRLLQIAAASGLVQQVVAHVLPGNEASSRLVARLGFSMGQSFVDHDGKIVANWIWRVGT